MPIQHTVVHGEGVSRIAFKYGFFPDTIWNDPANAELKAKREDMDILEPGDVVTIPDKRLKEETRRTEAVHRFQRLGVPAKLKIQLLVDDEKSPNHPFEITVDGRKIRGMADADGVLEVSVFPNAGEAVLKTEPEGELTRLVLGGVRPLETLAGVKTRLNNLGFDCGDPYGPEDDETRRAVGDFQALVGLTVNGDWQDAATQAKIEELHDTTAEPPEPDEGDAS